MVLACVPFVHSIIVFFRLKCAHLPVFMWDHKKSEVKCFLQKIIKVNLQYASRTIFQNNEHISDMKLYCILETTHERCMIKQYFLFLLFG